MKMVKNRYTIRYIYPTQAFSVLIVLIGSLVDGIMINTFLGDTAQAAYGLTVPLIIVNAALCGLISNGVQVLTGKSAGNNDNEAKDKIFSTATVLGLILTVCIVIPILLMPQRVAIWLGAINDEMIQLTADYIQVISLSFPLMMVTSMFPALFTLSGRKIAPLIAAAFLCIVNIVFNYLNIKIIHWGMRGMALATVLAYIVCFASFMIDRSRATEKIFAFRIEAFDKSLIKELLLYGNMYFVYKICTAIMSFAFLKKLSSMGENFLTANAILTNVALFTESFTSASNNTTNMLCSYWIGKKDNDGLKNFMNRMIKTSLLIHICLTVICIFGSRAVVRVFHVESELTFGLTVTAICLYSLCMPFNAINGIYRTYDLCTGKRVQAYILTLLNFLIMPLAAMFIVAGLCKSQYIWMAYVMGQGLVTIVATGKMLFDWRKEVLV